MKIPNHVDRCQSVLEILMIVKILFFNSLKFLVILKDRKWKTLNHLDAKRWQYLLYMMYHQPIVSFNDSSKFSAILKNRKLKILNYADRWQSKCLGNSQVDLLACILEIIFNI